MDPVDPRASSETVQASCSRSDPSRLKRVRLVHVDHRQLCWTMLDVERLVDEDHPARAIWELVGQLDLSAFADRIGSLEGSAGRSAFDPQLLVSLWIYAYSRGIGSAREVERRCEHDPGFRWLTGLLIINHHTLSDFRLAHHDALNEVFTSGSTASAASKSALSIR
jgi:transposase